MKGDFPAISVCIPFYNGKDNLERLLKSISLQRWEGRPITSENIEVIITIDNPEVTESEIQELGNNLGLAIAVYKNSENIGTTRNWNKALKLGRGEIITLMHDDDYYHSDKVFEHIVQVFKKNKNTIMLISNAILENSRSGARNIQFPKRKTSMITTREFVKSIFDGYCSAPSSTFIRRESLKGMQEDQTLYDEEFIWCPEIDLYRRLAANNKNASVYVDATTNIVRGISAQQYSAFTRHMQIQDYLLFIKRIEEDGNISKETKILLSKRCKEVLAKPVLDALRMFCGDLAQEKYREKSCRQCIEVIFKTRTIVEVNIGLRSSLLKALNEKTGEESDGHICKLSSCGILEYFGPVFKSKIKRILDRKTISAFRKEYKDSNLDSLFYKKRDELMASEFFNRPTILYSNHKLYEKKFGQILEHTGLYTLGICENQATSKILDLSEEIKELTEQIRNIKCEEKFKTAYKEQLALRLVLSNYIGSSPILICCRGNIETVKLLINCFPQSKILHLKPKNSEMSTNRNWLEKKEVHSIQVDKIRSQLLSTIKEINVFIGQGLSTRAVDLSTCGKLVKQLTTDEV